MAWLSAANPAVANAVSGLRKGKGKGIKNLSTGLWGELVEKDNDLPNDFFFSFDWISGSGDFGMRPTYVRGHASRIVEFAADFTFYGSRHGAGRPSRNLSLFLYIVFVAIWQTATVMLRVVWKRLVGVYNAHFVVAKLKRNCYNRNREGRAEGEKDPRHRGSIFASIRNCRAG